MYSASPSSATARAYGASAPRGEAPGHAAVRHSAKPRAVAATTRPDRFGSARTSWTSASMSIVGLPHPGRRIRPKDPADVHVREHGAVGPARATACRAALPTACTSPPGPWRRRRTPPSRRRRLRIASRASPCRPGPRPPTAAGTVRPLPRRMRPLDGRRRRRRTTSLPSASAQPPLGIRRQRRDLSAVEPRSPP